jgi:hypothetical protein
MLRWSKGWYYLFSTVGGYPTGYVLLVDRSRDLKTWEPSPFNPAMTADPNDKLIYNREFTPEQRDWIANATDCDNSDIDICDFHGKLLINYCWGNQTGKEFVSEAEFKGSTEQFLESWFPDQRMWAGVNINQPLSTFAANRSVYGRVLSATGSTVAVSSSRAGTTTDYRCLLSGDFSGPFAFHTDAEANPWVTIDLGRQGAITGLLIRNRTDVCQDRATSLRLQVSKDGKNWQEVWTATDLPPAWEIPLLSKNIRARYVRLNTLPKTPTPLHLQHVEIWGKD